MIPAHQDFQTSWSLPRSSPAAAHKPSNSLRFMELKFVKSWPQPSINLRPGNLKAQQPTNSVTVLRQLASQPTKQDRELTYTLLRFFCSTIHVCFINESFLDPSFFTFSFIRSLLPLLIRARDCNCWSCKKAKSTPPYLDFRDKTQTIH